MTHDLDGDLRLGSGEVGDFYIEVLLWEHTRLLLWRNARSIRAGCGCSSLCRWGRSRVKDVRMAGTSGSRDGCNRRELRR
jgi:hypothetical protein